MDILNIIEKSNKVRQLIQDFVNDKCSRKDVQNAVNELRDCFEIQDKTSDTPQVEEIVDLKESGFYLKDNKLLQAIERNDKGIAFKETYGYVIFLTKDNLKELIPTSEIKDKLGLTWKLSIENDTAVARNEIGDIVSGMKHIQELIDGESAIEL